MKGKLFGIGTGPGDSELLTLKAISTMQKCDIIAVPNGGSCDKAAFSIVEKYIIEKPLIHCPFSMDKSVEARKEARNKVANNISKILESGKNVGFITLGDPTIYSTYMYIHKMISQRGFETEIISGIPSFIAAAAALNISLCEGDEVLCIIPGSNQTDKEIENLLNIQGNKVIMKSGKSLADVLKIVDKKGLSSKMQIVERCSMEEQQIYNNIEDFNNVGNASYFSIAIIKE